MCRSHIALRTYRQSQEVLPTSHSPPFKSSAGLVWCKALLNVVSFQRRLLLGRIHSDKWHGFPLSGRRPVFFTYGDKVARGAAICGHRCLLSDYGRHVWRRCENQRHTHAPANDGAARFRTSREKPTRVCQHLHIFASSFKLSRNNLKLSTPSVTPNEKILNSFFLSLSLNSL